MEKAAPAANVVEDTVKTLMAFDANGDGKLSRSELPERFQGLFDRADLNKDGFLTPDEIRKMAAAQAPPPEPEGRGGRGDGRGDGGEMNFIRFDPILAAVDTNGDGVISADEIKNSADAIRKLDKDGDGKVTREEAMPQRGPGRQELRPMKPLFITATAFWRSPPHSPRWARVPRTTPWRTAHYENVLGTSMEIKLIAASDEAEDRAEAAALAEIKRLNSVLSGYDPTSEFSRWARTRDQAARVSRRIDGGAETVGFLARAHRRRLESGGGSGLRACGRTRRLPADCLPNQIWRPRPRRPAQRSGASTRSPARPRA